MRNRSGVGAIHSKLGLNPSAIDHFYEHGTPTIFHHFGGHTRSHRRLSIATNFNRSDTQRIKQLLDSSCDTSITRFVLQCVQCSGLFGSERVSSRIHCLNKSVGNQQQRLSIDAYDMGHRTALSQNRRTPKSRDGKNRQYKSDCPDVFDHSIIPLQHFQRRLSIDGHAPQSGT